MPDKETRKQIFKKNLESMKHDLSEEDFELIAEKSEG
jgi:SpoVK/Ycf46/Vps4 family AAA+-type ATPase